MHALVAIYTDTDGLLGRVFHRKLTSH